jgi:hypothetical protein
MEAIAKTMVQFEACLTEVEAAISTILADSGPYPKKDKK